MFFKYSLCLTFGIEVNQWCTKQLIIGSPPGQNMNNRPFLLVPVLSQFLLNWEGKLSQKYSLTLFTTPHIVCWAFNWILQLIIIMVNCEVTFEWNRSKKRGRGTDVKITQLCNHLLPKPCHYHWSHQCPRIYHIGDTGVEKTQPPTCGKSD